MDIAKNGIAHSAEARTVKFVLRRCVGGGLLLGMLVLTGALLLTEVDLFFLERSVTAEGQPHFYLNPMIACAVGVLFGLGQPMRFIGNAIISCVGAVVFYIAYLVWPSAFSHVWFCLPLFFFWGASCPFGLAMAYHMILHPSASRSGDCEMCRFTIWITRLFYPSAFGSPKRGQDFTHVIDAFDPNSKTVNVTLDMNDGRGRRTYRVALPEKVQAGQVVRLKGQGERGSNGGEPGDLLLTLNFVKQ